MFFYPWKANVILWMFASKKQKSNAYYILFRTGEPNIILFFVQENLISYQAFLLGAHHIIYNSLSRKPRFHII